LSGYFDHGFGAPQYADIMSMDEARAPLGDMPPEDFRRYAHQIVDWIADYLAHPERYPVLSQNQPGDVKNALPSKAPARGEAMEAMLADLDRVIVPGVTHWNHPGFFAYFAISGSAPGILGEMLGAAFNVNAMLWRTSPSATELEEVTIEWLREMLGVSAEFGGVIYDSASISSLCAIAAAREAVTELQIREEGLSGSDSRLRLYCSEQAHSSIDRAVITLGIGQQGVRKISTDSEFRMEPRSLAEAIEEDRANGWRPFCVVATVGTTSTTSIDPVPEIAEICNREGLWLHVDAAYGGSAAVVPEMKWILDGSEHADSIVVNPHKWMFVPVDLSVLFCRRMGVLRQAFSLVPEYLRTSDADEIQNFMDYGPQLGRRFRAIKLWFVMRYFGVEGLAARLREHIAIAREFAEWVDLNPNFERLAPVPFSVVCFRAHPQNIPNEPELDKLNETLMEEVNRRGKVYLSHTKLKEVFTLRLAIGNIRTTREHVKLAWDELNEVLAGASRGSKFEN
jgi:aromatic-L-amino-acid/L-tryptophan decarboxylase